MSVMRRISVMGVLLNFVDGGDVFLVVFLNVVNLFLRSVSDKVRDL